MTAQGLHRTFAGLAGLIVGTALVWGFLLVGSPEQERLRKLDERRIRELQAIRNAVRSLCVEHSHGKTKLVAAIPGSLAELDERVKRGDVVSLALQVSDPQSGQPYGFRRLGESQFEVCADFSLRRDRRLDPFWNHESGRSCFRFDVLEHAEGQAAGPPAGAAEPTSTATP